jgi:hypothetical protein
MIGLALSLVGLTVAVHVIAATFTRQRPATGLIASAQLGVPSAVVALGLQGGALSPEQAGAIIAASIVSLGVCSIGVLLLARETVEEPLAPPGGASPGHSTT